MRSAARFILSWACGNAASAEDGLHATPEGPARPVSPARGACTRSARRGCRTATTMVTLGSASTYAALSGASIGNTVSAPGDPHTTLRGDLGVVANAQPTGFPPGVATGAVNVGNAAAVQAGTDALAAYNDIAARTGGAALAGALAGATITPGLYIDRRRRVEHRDRHARRSGRPERRLRLPGQRRHDDGRAEPRRARQRRPGLPGLLAGQRRRRHRRGRRASRAR